MSLLNFLKKIANSVDSASGSNSKPAEPHYDKKQYTFGSLPTNLEELKALSKSELKDPFEVAALAILSFNVFPENKEECYKMLDYLKGPKPLLPTDKQFISDRFMDGKEYIARSYMKGAVPSNNYKPNEPYVIEVMEGAYSRQLYSEGYITLFIQSGGADSPRQIKLRTKPSTGEWFIWEFSGILMSMRIPVSQNEWA